MRIFWFTENYPPNKGGMARSCDRIVANLRKHHTVDVYHFTNKLKPFQSQASIGGLYTAVPVYEDTSHTLNVLWAFLSGQKKLVKNTVFVAYGSHLSLRGIPLMAKWLEVPYMLCLRGNDFDTSIFSPKKQELLYAIKNAAAVACVSSEKVNRIKAMQLNKNLFFTPNSIHQDSWTILKSDIALSKSIRAANGNCKASIIGLVGYLKEKKGIDFFITTLLKSVLSTTVHLRIVGELEPQIENRLNELHISYSVVVPESQSELIANYLSCDAIAIPSIYDGMPNVLFEAGTLNIPIIASKAGGLPDILDKDCAFLFDTLSEQSLLESIHCFHKASKGDLRSMTKRLKGKITDEFTPEREVRTYLEILKQIH